MDNKRGAPLKYPDENELVRKANEYLSTTGRSQTSLPTIEGLALYLDLDDDNVNEYSKRYTQFHATIKRLKSKQKNQLIDDGLYGGKEINAGMAIFLLKANHGMIETEKRILVGGEDNKPIQIKIVEERKLNGEQRDRVADKKLPEAAEHI